MSDRIEALLDTTRLLTAAVQAETEKLLQNRPADMAEEIAAKERLAATYAQLTGSLKPLKKSLADIAIGRRAELQTAIAQLDVELARNAGVLKNLHARTTDLLDAVAAAINPAAKTVSTYSATGRTINHRAGGSIALNMIF
jgi:hypothetical protein